MTNNTEDNLDSAKKYEIKTEALELVFRSMSPPHLFCDNCGYDMDAWMFWETVVLEAIEMQRELGSQHVLEQLEKADELFFAECPECGEVSDFRGNP